MAEGDLASLELEIIPKILTTDSPLEYYGRAFFKDTFPMKHKGGGQWRK